ncbi:MAG: transposase, partial [Ideonella sp.]
MCGLAEVLEVPCAYLVFAVSHALNSLYCCDPRWFTGVLFWSQDLSQHLHLHAVMACGVLGPDGLWHVPARRPDFLFPVRAL